MSSAKKEISIGKRKIIIKLRKEGKSYGEIAELVGRQRSSIQYVVQSFNKSGILESKPRSGRPSKITERETRFIINCIKKTPQVTAFKIAQTIKEQFGKEICEDTIRRITKKHGYRSRVARRKPFITKINRKKRLNFAKEHINKPQSFWDNVIFSDESKFCIFGIKGRKLIWRKPCTALSKENLLPTVKHGGGGVMVWGCMASSGVGNLVFIDSTMDQYQYLNILKGNLKDSAVKLGLNNSFWFQQDNDPKHTAKKVKLWLLYNVSKQLNSPPQSPDLNPIEHLWSLLEKKIRSHVITSKDMLKRVLLEEWSKISPEETANLVRSMNRRLNEVVRQKGYPTSY